MTCLILYLYSMDLGVPPLYAEANRIAIDMNFDYLDSLGPFLQTLSFIPILSEKSRQPSEMIQMGSTLSKTELNMYGSFILWKGAKM